MAVEAGARAGAPVVLNFSANLILALVLFVLGSGTILHFGTLDPALHGVLDTSVALSGALVALLLWDISRRIEQSWPLFLAISFMMLAVGELLHMIAVLGWASVDFRNHASSWGPPAYILLIGVGASFLLRNRPRSSAWLLAAGLVLAAIALAALFFAAPRYSEPGFLGVTRPLLIAVPFLWVAVGTAYWRHREESDAARAIAFSAVLLIVAHGVMLYSRSPSDPAAMVAHLGKFIGDALLLFNLTQIGAADTARRRTAERELVALNRELDQRVIERTAAQRKSQDLIEAIVASSPAAMYVKDLTGRYLMANQRFGDIFEVTGDAIVGKTEEDMFGETAARSFRAIDERIVRSGKPLTVEETLQLPAGPRTFISIKAPLRNDTGQVYAVFGISTDISDRKRAEETLLASEQRNRLVIESALDGAVTIDAAGAIKGWNRQAAEIFGWTEAEVLGRQVEDIVMPERYRAAHRDGLARFIATGEGHVLNQRIELEALHRDGHEFPVELAITPIRMPDRIVFTAFIRDITNRKQATARLQAQLDRLHLLEHVTRAVGQRQDVQSIFQVVVRTLEDQLPADFVCICRYDRVGHALTVLHVGTGSAPLGHELGIVDRAEIPIDQNGLSRCVEGELVCEADTAEIDFPFPTRLANHGLRSVVVAPLIFEDDVFGVLIVARRAPNAFDSTDCEFLRQLAEHVALAAHQAQLRDSLQQAYDDLRQTQQAVIEQERLHAIGQMASGIAHDINNAISPVAVYTQSLLERDIEIQPDVQDYLELVGRVVNDVASTVGRMRDFYRPDAAAEVEPLDLNLLVPQVVELTRARWNDMPLQRGVVVNVSTQLQAELPRVMANATELREALTNLIFNAVDAMPEGGTITVRTETLAAAPGGKPHVRLEVGDTGAGMDEETRLRCLEPFFTTKGERGTGLGLAMVQGAAQRHNAVLEIDSAPGKGTRVRLDFAAIGKVPARKPRAAATRATRPLRVLLIDDDPAVLHSTEAVLKLKGHSITAADSGQAGIEALQAAHGGGERYDLTITDLGMPYVDGNQVARKAKELFPDMPVVLLTGWGRRMATDDEAPAHVDFVLSKPLDLSELGDVFDRIG